MFYIDPLFLLVLAPGVALSLWASWQVKATFNRYRRVGSSGGYTGAQAAHMLLRRSGVRGVSIEEVGGFLSDHYDPFKRVLRLSPDVYHGQSLSSLGVAAHEAGHAIQHATGYLPLKFRSLVVKPAMLGSNLGGILCALGLGMQTASGMDDSNMMLWAGIILFSVFVLFTLVTLPVEFDASRRAVAALAESGLIVRGEVGPTQKVLRAAALTYVAAAITAILQLLYFLFRAGLLGGRREQ